MAESATTAGVIPEEKKRRNYYADLLIRLVKEKPLGTVGGVIVVVFLIVGIFANFIAPYGYNEMVLGARLQAPSAKYLLGTDNLGRDLLSRIIYGARISVIVGLSVSAINTVLSTFLGTLSGYLGGKVDLVIQRFVDVVMSFPALVLMLTIVAITGPGMIQIILILGILGGIGGTVRVVRSAVMSVKENMYVEASRSIGATSGRIMIKHIVPNIMPVVIIGFSLFIGGAILAEATLSFLGLGIPPPAPSWGGMLSGPARQYMLQAPWMAIWPGLALSLVVYGTNMLGDALRDLIDPRLRGGIGRYGRALKMQKKVSRNSGN